MKRWLCELLYSANEVADLGISENPGQSVPVADFAARAVWPPDTYVIAQYFFACEAEILIPTLSAEHTESRWVNYEDAVSLLRYDGNRTAVFELSERLRRDDLPEPIRASDQ